MAGALLVSCQTSPPPNAAASVDTHEAMVRWVNPASIAIWDVTNSAAGESGELDPALMDAAAWAKLDGAARMLETHSRHLADAEAFYVGAHNDNVEGFATRAEIQAMIDADPDGFRELSRQMAEHAGELVQVSATRDIRQAGVLADGLSERCSTCHSRYWEKPVS